MQKPAFTPARTLIPAPIAEGAQFTNRNPAALAQFRALDGAYVAACATLAAGAALGVGAAVAAVARF